MNLLDTRLRSEIAARIRQKTASEGAGYLLAKRLIDIVVSLAALVLLSPLLVAVALAIKLEDPKGPVLFRQVRIGKDGKPFVMLKFRSMVRDAESRLEALLPYNEVEGNMFKMKNDPRVTRVGRFIRKWSIDEFPQLWNVIKGDMTLVGPRPPLPREVKNYSPYDMNRLTVTPGCTGLWQISGRNALSFRDMVELDLAYITNRNLRLDLKIIRKTCVMLLVAKNGM
jgi:lipopolysaccharide/colanic/teichoic acid biosynthesis glycosyltransferase